MKYRYEVELGRKVTLLSDEKLVNADIHRMQKEYGKQGYQVRKILYMGPVDGETNVVIHEAKEEHGGEQSNV